jgi:hypothetical protein
VSADCANSEIDRVEDYRQLRPSRAHLVHSTLSTSSLPSMSPKKVRGIESRAARQRETAVVNWDVLSLVGLLLMCFAFLLLAA